MKTNKSFTSRIKVSKRGKLLTRKPGKNHFNAKESRRKQVKKGALRSASGILGNKGKGLFIPHESNI